MDSARDRLIAAAIDLVTERGYREATPAAITERAGSSADEFRLHFASADDCCRGAFEAVCDSFDRHLLPIYLRPAPWRERMRAAARATADFCREHEEQVSFAIGEQLRRPGNAGGERSLRLHLREVDAVRWELADPEQVPRSAAEFAVGCFLERAMACHASGELGQIELWLPDLMYSVTGAFLGTGPAEEELDLLEREAAVDGRPGRPRS